MGLPVERSVKLIIWGAQPDVGDAEKFAVTWLLLLKLKKISKINTIQLCLSIALINIGIAVLGFMMLDKWIK